MSSIGTIMITTIKIAIVTIQSLCPACISNGLGVGWAASGVGVIVLSSCLVADGVDVVVPGVGLNVTGMAGANAMLENRMINNRVKMRVMEWVGVIVQKFTKTGDRVSPQYNTAERGVFLSNFNL